MIYLFDHINNKIRKYDINDSVDFHNIEEIYRNNPLILLKYNNRNEAFIFNSNWKIKLETNGFNLTDTNKEIRPISFHKYTDSISEAIMIITKYKSWCDYDVISEKEKNKNLIERLNYMIDSHMKDVSIIAEKYNRLIYFLKDLCDKNVDINIEEIRDIINYPCSECGYYNCQCEKDEI